MTWAKKMKISIILKNTTLLTWIGFTFKLPLRLRHVETSAFRFRSQFIQISKCVCVCVCYLGFFLMFGLHTDMCLQGDQSCGLQLITNSSRHKNKWWRLFYTACHNGCGSTSVVITVSLIPAVSNHLTTRSEFCKEFRILELKSVLD